MGVRTCSDLQRFTQSQLQRQFGAKTGSALYRHCQGKDDRVLNFGHQRKSVSADVNYGIRFTNQEEVAVFIKQLAGEVSSRLRKVRSKGRCITLKLMVRISNRLRNCLLISVANYTIHVEETACLYKMKTCFNHFSSFWDEVDESAISNVCYILVLIKLHSLWQCW
jgi:nucleotidyltransferase/DNA polymerase involved in DNA repair